ncbi:hypothetical protein K470DRAFT_258926 [Piedraia hortae CBS 480.64]|uniref:Zn(2)-C6 fungal-type domain-containing protein n=1 Tax=Piedraia hortae CBS 480.64 TaxID=1314780 RepID=A0A6A7BW54_9PEZI|nr:hypothetical protein K470DRAFT_258926 [Piedraia hortae CBS 480.64]
MDNGLERKPSERSPGVRRACTECRQQKLRCNVISGPGDYYKPCDRCSKAKLDCRIDTGFKRKGKRAAHGEVLRELEEARTKLRQYESLSSLGRSEAVASRGLIDLSQSCCQEESSVRTLQHITLTETQLGELYETYFSSYHPFLPLLNPDYDYRHYHGLHLLLHWTIISIAARRYTGVPGLLFQLQRPLEELLWSTVSRVPQVYHVCKALALLCTWPLPSSSTSQEPTMILVGIMFQLAMQHGLHRPSHAQDFSRVQVEVQEEDIVDRLNTWASVNVVAQMVSTGQGQPSLSRWAWYSYGQHLSKMKPALQGRCQIEKFVDTVTKTLYTMQRDHVVDTDEVQRALQIDMYASELAELEITLISTGNSIFDIIHLKAAGLHLRLCAFFSKPSQPNYATELRNCYISASSLLKVVTTLNEDVFFFLPRYVEQMVLAAAIALFKLLHSSYATQIDSADSRILFADAVTALRRLSIRPNDLPQRLAEVTAQLWMNAQSQSTDDHLQLKVRCRGSLSLLFDAIWKWRQQVSNADQSLERAVEHPTVVLEQTYPLDDTFDGVNFFDTLSWMLDQDLQPLDNVNWIDYKT